MTGRSRLLAALLAVTLLALAACATPARTRYYSLVAASPPPAGAAGTSPEYRVVVGPVGVPESVDRPQMVLRMAPNRYAISDAEHWLEPLKSQIARAVAEKLAEDLPAAQVAADPQFLAETSDYRVLIEVLRFESLPGEAAVLEAEWQVRSGKGERLREARSVLVEPVHDAGVAPLVAAHAAALAALADEIAKAVDLIRARR